MAEANNTDGILYNQRFDKIERKLDELWEVLIKLATIEERLGASLDGTKRLGKKIEDLETEVDELKLQMAKKQTRSFERLLWALLSVCFSIITYYMTKG